MIKAFSTLIAVVLCNAWGHGWFASHTLIALDGGYGAGMMTGFLLWRASFVRVR